MDSNRKVLCLQGDGIGPEIFTEVKRVVDWFDKNLDVGFSLEEDLVGGAAYDKHKTPLTEETLGKAHESDAILLGAVGGPKYDSLSFEVRPERALLKLRKSLDLFANIRPAKVYNALIDSSSLKREVVKDMDIILLRELTSGIYFGKPRGIKEISKGEKEGINTEIYTTSEIKRLAEVGFELAKKRLKLVHSVEKANVMESGMLWREEVSRLHLESFKDCKLFHMYADNCAMQLVRNPKQFDVIITGNLFGDILSDISAELTGSLGMLPSASLGAVNENGFRKAMYEPVHGSAPDISGLGCANPIAMLLSYAMMLRYSFDREEDANLIESAISDVLDSGLRTRDIARSEENAISTEDMGKAICDAMYKRTH